jgi:hypothetical protein
MTDGTSATTDLTLGVDYAIVVVAECHYGCSPMVAGQFVATHPSYITVGKPAPAKKNGDSGLSPGATAGVVIVRLLLSCLVAFTTALTALVCSARCRLCC